MNKIDVYLEALMGQEDKVEKEVNVSGGVIVKMDEDGVRKLLLIKRSPDDHWPNVWEFCRGKCDYGPKEKLIPCLKREVKEEIGLDIEVLSYIDKFEYFADHGKRKSTQYNFLCTPLDSTQKISLSKEHSEFKWITSIGEVELNLMSSPECIKTIKKAFNTDMKITDIPENPNVEKIEEVLNSLNDV